MHDSIYQCVQSPCWYLEVNSVWIFGIGHVHEISKETILRFSFQDQQTAFDPNDL